MYCYVSVAIYLFFLYISATTHATAPIFHFVKAMQSSCCNSATYHSNYPPSEQLPHGFGAPSPALRDLVPRAAQKSPLFGLARPTHRCTGPIPPSKPRVRLHKTRPACVPDRLPPRITGRPWVWPGGGPNSARAPYRRFRGTRTFWSNREHFFRDGCDSEAGTGLKMTKWYLITQNDP